MAVENTSWLNVSRLSGDVWRIEDGGVVAEYLLTGDEKALLIDCGWGIGKIAETVAKLTRLPLTVINTHGHHDHTDGNYQFDNVYINEGDVPLLKKSYSPADRFQVLKRFPEHTLPEDFSGKEWLHAPLRHFTPFKGSMSFELGSRTVDVIETPGHTPGSICLYDHRERLLFAGDNILAGKTLLMLPDSLPLATYAKSVDKLAAMADRIDKIYPAHGPVPLKPAALKEMQAGVRKVLDGKFRGRPEKTFLGSGLACSFGSCGILYDEHRLQ